VCVNVVWMCVMCSALHFRMCGVFLHVCVCDVCSDGGVCGVGVNMYHVFLGGECICLGDVVQGCI